MVSVSDERAVYNVQVIETAGSTNSNAFQHKCTAIDAFDQIIVCGIHGPKSFVCPLVKDSSERQIRYELNIQDYETRFRGASAIQVIKYLPRLDYFVLLHDKQLSILKELDLMPIMTYNRQKKITNFCLNEEVYRSSVASGRNVSQTDQICFCSNNTLFFLEAE